MIKNSLVILLAYLLILGCAANSKVYSLEEVEKHRLSYIDGKENSVALLVNMYQDPSQSMDVRMAALKALKESRHPLAVEAVQQTVSGSSLIELDLMIQSINLLKELGDESATPHLVKGLLSTEDKIMESRAAYVQAIGNVGTVDKITTLLDLYEISTRHQIRMDSLLTVTLGTMGDNQVIPWLIEIARDRQLDVRIRSIAIDILGKKSGPVVIDYFIDMLGDPGSNLKAKQFALSAVGDGPWEIEESKILTSLLTAYNQGKEEYSQLLNHLLNAVAEYRDPALIPSLKNIVVSDQYPQYMRMKALAALGDFKDDSVIPTLISILENPENYSFYSDIVDIITEMNEYDNYKNNLRLAAFNAHKRSTIKVEVTE